MSLHTPLHSAGRPRRGQRGQAFIIVGFLILFMVMLLGLVIDTVRLFTLAAQAERAAEAGALAGALYMPKYFTPGGSPGNPPSPDGHSAVERACAVVQQNGITNCPVSLGQIGATVSTVTGNQYEIEVTVTLQANVFFLAYIDPGLATSTVARFAGAQYLSPIELGSRYAYFGDESSQDATGGVPKQNFWARINGPLELKEYGDAYTPTYEEGPTNPIMYPDAIGGSNPYHFNRWSPSCCATNHQQWAGGPVANPDVQPAGFTDASNQPGYNYEVIVPTGSPSLELQIYNPAFEPASSVTSDDMGSACFDPTYSSGGGGCHITDGANEYMQLTYSLYSAPLQFERSQDTLIASNAYPSLDLYSGDLTKHGCGLLTPDYDAAAGKCVADPGYLNKWTTFNYPPGLLGLTGPVMLGPGTYRLAVAATGGYGEHGYGIKLTDLLGNPPPAGTEVWGWNNICVYFNVTGGTATFDLGEIPAAYADKTLDFGLFDPGDGYNVDMQILDNNNNPVPLPSWVRYGSLGNTDLEASKNGDSLYNGLWLHLPISIPIAYTPGPPNDWWTVKYIAGGTPTDTITIGISLSGSPVHLVQLLN